MDKQRIYELVARQDPLILDIGSYDGKDSLDFIQHYPSAIIHAFEPDTRSIDLFRKQVSHPNIILHEHALSQVDGDIVWYESNSLTRKHYSDQKEWSASSSMRPPKNHLNVFEDVFYKQPTSVPSKRLDTWADANAIARPDIAWIDVNGAEMDLIEGGLKTLSKTKVIVMEFSNTELFDGQATLSMILDRLNMFDNLGIFDYKGNFGNVLLKNRS